jgi:hypothetical protein
MTKSRGIGRGGARRGAGRKRGTRDPHTRVMLAELDRYRDPAVADLLPSVFLKRVMCDEAAPLPARIMCAAKVIPFIERKAPAEMPGEIPLMRLWTDAQFDDYRRRLVEDMLIAPGYYGAEFFRTMNVRWPLPPDSRGFKPDPKRRDPWFAQFDVDYRAGTGTAWEPGEREELQKLARASGISNGEDPDAA